jgi:UDP-N-acetylmuramoylalanine--D-glutamate ligase
MSWDVMIRTLATFTGLAHRCEHVINIDGVNYINDSKGTNVGATVAALNGMGPGIDGKIILIAGGVGKDADFSGLVAPLQRYGKQTILMGEDGGKIGEALNGKAPITFAKDMGEAVKVAFETAQKGDLVLLSPACASFDQYPGFEARGTHFSELVRALA